MALLLVEKGEDPPVSWLIWPLQKILSAIHPDLKELVDCHVCAAFWTAILTDIILFFITGGAYFLWPLTGFASSGISWLLMEMFPVPKDDE